MNKLFGILILGIVLFGCVSQPQIPPEQQVTNTTAYAKAGDKVSVDYTLKLADGSVLDTSLESVAKESGTFVISRKYQPLTFVTGPNSGLISGFNNGVMGMKVGETKLVVIQPKDGYGETDPSKINSIQLYYNMSRFEKVPLESLTVANIKIEKDNVIKSSEGVLITINDFDNETATLEYLIAPGTKFTFNGIPQIVVNATNDTIFLKLDLEKGRSYLSAMPDGTQKQTHILDVNETHAMVDENNPLAGKVLYFTITVKSIN